MIDTFKLTDQEALLAEVFEREHRHLEVDRGTIGGGISYTFYPNAIGTGVSVQCGICGKKENITEYNW